MNHDKEQSTWDDLLAQSRPAFTPPTEPPYGFVTATTARLLAERRQCDLVERIGLRAMIASLLTLGAVTALTFYLQVRDAAGVDPGVQSLAAVENVPLS